MARRKVRNPLAFAVLGSLSERPMHPYEMYQTLLQRREDYLVKIRPAVHLGDHDERVLALRLIGRKPGAAAYSGLGFGGSGCRLSMRLHDR